MASIRTVIQNLKFGSMKNGKLSIYYREQLLMVISEKVLLKAILDMASNQFLNSLAVLAGAKKETVIDNNLIQLSHVYAYEKLKFHKRKNVKSMSDKEVSNYSDKFLSDKKIVKYFKDTILLMKESGIDDFGLFVEAQIFGLKFANNGTGVFPSPAQLCSANALTRYLEHISKTSDSKTKQEKPKNYWYYKENIDGQLALRANAKYQEAIDKIKFKTASLDCAIYAQRCYAARRDGDNLLLIEKYISTISK